MSKTPLPHSSPPETQAQQLEKKQLAERMSKIKHKLIVLSGKGGVGKSTIALNLACALALTDRKVGLLDIDIHGPSIPMLLGMEGESIEVVDEVILPVRFAENLKVMSIGFLLSRQEDAVIWRGPLKMHLIKQFLKDVDWGERDYLVIDCPPGTGDEPLSIAQLLEDADGAIIVTTPQELALSDVRKCITFCRKLNLPVIGVVENMSGFVCPHCGKKVEIFKSGGGEKMAREMGVPFLSRIPIDPGVVESGDTGKPFIYDDAESDTTEAFKQVIESVIELEKDNSQAKRRRY